MKISSQSLRNIALFSSAVLLGTFTIYKSSLLNAQTVSSPLSGKFACLLNANFSGFNAKVQGSTTGINGLFVINFSSNGLTGNLMGGISNQISNFNTLNASVSQQSQGNSVTFSVTPNNPTEYMFKLEASVTDPADQADQTYYLALTNGGNTGLFMQAPSGKQTMNGVCQKV